MMLVMFNALNTLQLQQQLSFCSATIGLASCLLEITK